jgi:hypothetical protein
MAKIRLGWLASAYGVFAVELAFSVGESVVTQVQSGVLHPVEDQSFYVDQLLLSQVDTVFSEHVPSHPPLAWMTMAPRSLHAVVEPMIVDLLHQLLARRKPAPFR